MAHSRKANSLSQTRKHSYVAAASLLLASVCLGISANAFQAGRSQSQEFNGTWKAIHDEKVYVLLTLQTDGDKPSGSIQLAIFQVATDGSGALTAITNEKLCDPIELRDVKFDAKVASFHFVDPDGDETKWRMELTGSGKANLLLIDLPPDVKFLPFPLVRQPSSNPKEK